MARILLINGSIRGEAGNTAVLLRRMRDALAPDVEVQDITLAGLKMDVAALADAVRQADGLVFGTGVYWNAYGSALQQFIEIMTAYEATDVFMGKPVGALVTMDSVGGTDVAARLLGVFNQLGCLVPPMAVVVISRLSLLAGAAGGRDVWQLEDIAQLAQNLRRCLSLDRSGWRPWPVEETSITPGCYPSLQPLPIDHAPWPHALFR